MPKKKQNKPPIKLSLEKQFSNVYFNYLYHLLRTSIIVKNKSWFVGYRDTLLQDTISIQHLVKTNIIPPGTFREYKEGVIHNTNYHI